MMCYIIRMKDSKDSIYGDYAVHFNGNYYVVIKVETPEQKREYPPLCRLSLDEANLRVEE